MLRQDFLASAWVGGHLMRSLGDDGIRAMTVGALGGVVTFALLFWFVWWQALLIVFAWGFLDIVQDFLVQVVVFAVRLRRARKDGGSP